LEEESLGWMFVNSIPLQYDKKRLAKQFQIETWLDLAQVMKELNIEKPNETKIHQANVVSYIV
jgi:hypothetical protein